MVFERLPYGKENAVKPINLANMFGLSERQLRKKILNERMAGYLIMSNCSTGGYYRPNDEKEIMEYIAMMEHQAKTRLAASKAARDYLKQMQGQLELNLEE